ncbi:20494_t:CDS:2, partial [Gigaspora rosea]
QGTKKYDKMGLTYVGYLKIMQCKRDPNDHCRYVAKQQAPNKKAYNKRMADFKDWYNKEMYQSFEKLYKLYLLFANQEEVIQKRSTEEQSNQELHEVVSQLAKSNRNFEQRLYTLKRVIGIWKEKI